MYSARSIRSKGQISNKHLLMMIAGALFHSLFTAFFSSCSLTALKKKKSGVWPITDGKYLRQLDAKFPLQKSRQDSRELFEPYQLVVSITAPLSRSIIPRKTILKKITSSKKAGVLHDFQNAFSSVNRNFLTIAVTKFTPELAVVSSFCY